jgi:hypothetical protein
MGGHRRLFGGPRRHVSPLALMLSDTRRRMWRCYGLAAIVVQSCRPFAGCGRAQNRPVAVTDVCYGRWSPRLKT